MTQDDAFRWRPHIRAWAILGLSLAVVGIPLVILVPAYEVNDDPMRSMIVSGMLSGTPSHHILFSNVLIGFPLRALYDLIPGFDWYAAYLYGALLLATMGILSAFFRAARFTSATMWLLMIIIALLFRTALAPQFTTVAAACGAAGLGLLWTSVSYGPPQRLRKAAGISMLVLAVMIRIEIVALLFLAAPPLLLDRQRRVALLPPLLVTTAAACTVVGFDAWYYARDPAWTAYFDFVSTSELLLDNDWAASHLDNIRSVVGWSRNDAIFFLLFVFMHDEIFSLANIKALADALPVWESADFVPILLHELSKGFKGENAILAAGLVLAAISAMGSAEPGRRKTIALTLLTTLAAIVGIAVQLKLPTWVAAAILLLAAFACALAPGAGHGESPPPQRRRPPWVNLVLAALFLGLAVPWTRATVHRVQENRLNDLGPAFQYMDEAFPDDAVFITFGLPPYHPMRPFRQDESAWRVRLIVNGWYVPSPLYYECLALHGIEDPFASLWEKPNVYAMSEPFIETMVPEFAQQHYGVAVESERLKNLGGRFGDNFIWKFRLKPGSNSPGPGYQLTDET